MAEAITIEGGLRIVGPDGTTIFEGGAQVKNVIQAVNGEASAVLARGEAARIDPTNSDLMRWDKAIGDTQGVKDAVKVLRVSALTDVGFLGVALNSAPAGGTVAVAGSGSVLCVKCVSGSGTVGNAYTGSATAGSVGNQAAPSIGQVLGVVVKAPGTAAGQTGTLTQGGVLVAPR